jgi:bifunctional ADP-heptose synthase (sugar kinase/adenylyltransferase)
MLTDAILDQVLRRIPRLTVGVVGDLFLDRYLDLDGTLTEPSLETGLDAYQVVGVRASPGAAGTVINNLVALGVRRVLPVAVLGADGEGAELRQALDALKGLETRGRVLYCAGRRTPTYLKPLLRLPGQPARELNRLDVKNRTPLPADAEGWVLGRLRAVCAQSDVVLVLDQVSEADCGVVTARVRERLAELGAARPGRLILADSRERIGLFRGIALKPNECECLRAAGGGLPLEAAAVRLARNAGRPVFCTRGERGILVADPTTGALAEVPAYPVQGPIDPVGAGDSTSAGIACALACGADLTQAAAFGCLVASITVQQLGTTGTATPEQVRQRWAELRRG